MALVLSGGTVATSLAPPRLATTDVIVENGRVTGLGQRPGGAVVRDCSGCLVIPGNVCAHTHLYSALARGMPYDLEPPADFLQILQRIWWRLDRTLDEDLIRASAMVGATSALLAGTTTVVDHHASPNAIDGSLSIVADALAELGLRSALSYEVTDRDGQDRMRAGLRENERFLAEVPTRPLARGHVGAHASFTLSQDSLDACVEVARRSGVGLHIHVAEDAVDQLDARARYGTGVAERLALAGALSEDAVLAHCIHLDDDEIRLVRESGATVVHNPTSNMNNAVGHARVLALGERLALGTDGIGADMFAESKAAYFRARDDDVSARVGWPVERAAEGARLAGAVFEEPLLGHIEPGAPADLIVLDYEAPTPLTEGNLAGHWIFGIDRGSVRDVMIAGELVVADRMLARVDQAELAAHASEQAARLWLRLEDTPAHGFEPQLQPNEQGGTR